MCFTRSRPCSLSSACFFFGPVSYTHLDVYKRQPSDHWLNDPLQGGGRILGEVCHLVDFLCFLTNASPVEVETRSLPNPGQYSNDNIVCSLRFPDGSQGTISYLANGDKSYSKERIEVFGGGNVAVLEDFRRLELVRSGKKRVFRSLMRQNKGHRGEWKAFVTAIQTGAESPIPFRELVSTTLATFALEAVSYTHLDVYKRQL